MGWVFYITAVITVAGALGAMLMRNLVHCALFLAISFVGVAVMFLQLGVPFAAFAQLLVYVGAVAILILFAVLLTKSGGTVEEKSSGAVGGLAVTILVAGAIVASISSSEALGGRNANNLVPTTKKLGEVLMARQIISFEAIAVLLTVAMLGAVILAMPEKSNSEVEK